eukprot:2666538-Lingulodinium_polyedra.AAC.1
MLQDARVACVHLGLQVGVHAGALLLRNLLVDQAEGVMRAIGVARWTRACNHPVRLTATTATGDDNRIPVAPPPLLRCR